MEREYVGSKARRVAARRMIGSGRFTDLPSVVQGWAVRLAAACKQWPDWRLAPADVLYLIGAEWDALREVRVTQLFPQLSELEIEWNTRAYDAWFAWEKKHPGTAPARMHFLTVARARPEAALHVDAVRAALRDGRLLYTTWAKDAGLSHRVVTAWLADEPVEDTWESYLWAAAVKTTVPGWPSPREATVRKYVLMPRPSAER